MTDDSNDETNFPDKLVFTDTQASRLRNSFTSNSSANIKFSITQLSKMIQLGGFLPLQNSIILFEPVISSVKSLANSFGKKLKNKGIHKSEKRQSRAFCRKKLKRDFHQLQAQE